MARSRRLGAALIALAAGLASSGCGDASPPGPKTATGRDCGTVVTRAPVEPALPCFDAAFKNCNPAHVLIENRGKVLAGTKVLYTIRGREGADCRVSYSYVALPGNPKWERKDVNCPVAPGAKFLAAVGARHDFTGCRGPLMALING